MFVRWSITHVPPCASICDGYLPAAPFETDLTLKYVISGDQVNVTQDYKEFNETDKWMYSGDKLRYFTKNTET